MTNKDKYLKDEADIKQLSKEIDNFVDKDLDMKYFIPKFFEQEVKPALTEDERVILRNLPREWKYINRIDGRVCIKQELEDSTNLGINYLFPDLFQFIKERRRIRDK